ncbi:D-alanyl-D-alanine carboxypeptidase family protein [Geoalkalibacter sp.]|uniref:D-alanyl-D-alanine carboxypeptidase family protein n=1 Tax=Geoalkalibacter sp. TaxID=3041440 RepID=UPI00272DF783|nr:D-alanyl-D-alanine carboxypeptidase family protein [Geoalkalibacter sp.]
MKFRALLFLAAALIFAIPTAFASGPFPVTATAALVKTGNQVVWSHQADKRLPPASLTKVMTSLIVLEQADLDAVVRVSASAAAELGSRLQLHEGDQLYVGDLLAALLIRSANDAAHALACHIAGSQEKFVTLMNRRAAELGLTNTRFQNASGWDHPQHYSTAADLARLTEYAMHNKVFRNLVSMEELQIQTLNGERTWDIKNSNKLLGHYDGLMGVKTGYTSKAGPCLIALAERGTEQVLVVLLNSPKRWEETPQVMDWVFHRNARTAERNSTAVFAASESPAPATGHPQKLEN